MPVPYRENLSRDTAIEAFFRRVFKIKPAAEVSPIMPKVDFQED